MKTTRFAAKSLTAVTAALLLAGSLAGCDAAANALEIIESASGASGAPDPGGPVSAGDAANALVQLDGIPVKGRAPKTGYSRDKFGPAWADADRMPPASWPSTGWARRPP